eukprot:m.304085 g.304085  ORF g.304085 m.304085 type:complete len:75 (-) comp27313_c0_seq4:373-597(-)
MKEAAHTGHWAELPPTASYGAMNPRRMTFWAGVPTTHAASTTDTTPIGVGLIAKGPNHEPNVVDCWGDRVIFER